MNSRQIQGHTYQGWKAKFIRLIKDGAFGNWSSLSTASSRLLSNIILQVCLRFTDCVHETVSSLEEGSVVFVRFILLCTLDSLSGKLWVLLSLCCSMLVHHWESFPFRLRSWENKRNGWKLETLNWWFCLSFSLALWARAGALLLFSLLMQGELRHRSVG